MIDGLFAPLGYTGTATPIELDPAHPDWGASPYVARRLSVEVRLAALPRLISSMTSTKGRPGSERAAETASWNTPSAS